MRHTLDAPESVVQDDRLVTVPLSLLPCPLVAVRVYSEDAVACTVHTTSASYLLQSLSFGGHQFHRALFPMYERVAQRTPLFIWHYSTASYSTKRPFKGKAKGNERMVWKGPIQ